MAEASLQARTPKQVAEFYGFPGNYTGKGQKVAIISLGAPTNMTELENDFKTLGVPTPKVTETVVDAKDIPASQNSGNGIETHLDVEVIGSICPDAEITIYRGPNTGAGFANTVRTALADSNSVISISWGGSENADTKNSMMETILAIGADIGTTITAATGDYGSSNYKDPNTGHAAAAPDGKVHLNYPASSPWVLACGGTELTDENGETIEVVWNQTFNDGGGDATGGGVSESFDKPDWQSELNVVSASTGKSGRIVPDVSAIAASNEWDIKQSGFNEVMGGTSAVAPLWAAFITLANQARIEAGKSSLGYLNEKLYKLAASDKSLFNDVTQGNNKSAPDFPGYDAQSSFDACTGWGSPSGNALFKALVALD